MKNSSSILLLTVFSVILCFITAQHNHIYDGYRHISHVRSVANGKRYHVNANDSTNVKDVSKFEIGFLTGSPYEMGVAHGRLFAEEIKNIFFTELPLALTNLKANVGIDNDALPNHVRERLQTDNALEISNAIQYAYEWLYDHQLPFMKKMKSGAIEEIEGIIEGYMTEYPNSNRDLITRVIRGTNMYPELIRMACSISQTWKSANAPGLPQPIHMRALDFNLGIVGKYATLIVRNANETSSDLVPSASLFLPGFAGFITSFNPYVSQSEKVYLDRDFPKNMRPGTYTGLGDIMYIREAMMKMTSLQEIYEFTKATTRTWSMFVGFAESFTTSTSAFDSLKNQIENVGSVIDEPAVVFKYTHRQVEVMNSRNSYETTRTATIPDTIYVDRRIQPSTSDPVLFYMLKEQHGKINAEWIVKNVPHKTQSGDGHIMVYDHNNGDFYIAVGLPDDLSNPKLRVKACNRPFFKFNIHHFW